MSIIEKRLRRIPIVKRRFETFACGTTAFRIADFLDFEEIRGLSAIFHRRSENLESIIEMLIETTDFADRLVRKVRQIQLRTRAR